MDEKISAKSWQPLKVGDEYMESQYTILSTSVYV